MKRGLCTKTTQSGADRIVSQTMATSGIGTKRTLRDVRLESVVRATADITFRFFTDPLPASTFPSDDLSGRD
jgi:hypothetical protein